MRKQTLLLLMISIFIGLITVSYAAFSENMLIDGEAIVRAPADIRVTDLRVNNLSNSGFETYNSKYSKEATNTYVTLPNGNSSVTYDVTVTNKSSSTYYLKAINELTYDNSNVEYEIIGIDIHDLVNPNSTATFQIRLTNKTSSRQSVELSLNYIFEEYIIYTITYNLNGGTNPANAPTSYSNISNTITLPTPTISILTFAGWYDNASFTGSSITQIPRGSTGNKTYYAKWNSVVLLTATYSGNYETFTVPETGTYRIELWGAQGGTTNLTGEGNISGKGAYTAGTIELTQNDTLYIYVGERGKSNASAYNGGGSATNGSTNISIGGGGATDIRLSNGAWNNAASLKSRIMVAGAGGGSTNYTDQNGNFTWSQASGGNAGGLTSYPGANSQSGNRTDPTIDPPFGANQIAGGIGSISYCHGIAATTSTCIVSGKSNDTYNGENGNFGQGGNLLLNASQWGGGGSGGGGYYGGGSGGLISGTLTSGSGGSSFISGHAGSIAISSNSSLTPRTGTGGASCIDGTTDIECSKHYSGYVFTNTVMIDGAGYSWTTAKQGQVQMPNPSGGYYATGVGHSGNGYARITYLGT